MHKYPKLDYSFLSPPELPDELGRLGPYRVLQLLGQGGMGIVFRAEDKLLNRTVALKVMRPDLARTQSARERFLREAQAAAQIEHDNVIHINQVGQANGVPFIAMTLLKGMSLGEWIARGKPLTLPQIMRIGREAARGLQAAHARGLIHRDITPSNLWLDAKAKGRVKLLDFGLARTEGGTGITQLGQILGTPRYMAPEQFAGGVLDARADIFSLGVVLYRLCTGKLPFEGETPLEVMTALAMYESTHVCSMVSAIPRAFGDLIMRMIAKVPEDRPISAQQIVETIKQIEFESRSQGEVASRPHPLGFPTAQTSEDSEESLLSDADFEQRGMGLRIDYRSDDWTNWVWLLGGVVVLGALLVYLISLAR